MARDTIGFIGLGNMGRPLAGHIARNGFDLHVFDLAGTQARAPQGAHVAGGNATLASTCDVIFLSLPTVAANREVIAQICASARPGSVVVDTCTIGVQAAQENAAALDGHGIRYVDSPVSGLRSRAIEGTLASMCAGDPDAVARVLPLLECYSRVVYRVGEQPGQGQRMKVVNNALCMAHYVVVSEALAYGEAGGLDMATMLDVINASSGQNFTTSVSFPRYVLSGTFDSGADAAIIEKDLSLFMDGAAQAGTPASTLGAAYRVIKAFRDADPTRDAMHIYGFVKDGS